MGGSVVDTRVHRRADTHGKLRQISRQVGAQWPKAVHSNSSFKQEIPVRADRVAGCDQQFGNAREFIPGDHKE